MTNTSASALEVKNAVKIYGAGPTGVTALNDVSITVENNEFFTLLGPSGCGKTTLLRMIAGFETITGGSIRLFGENIESLPANKRPVNTVFQQYALFPHMTVLQNVAFGLTMLGKSDTESNSVARRMLDMVQLGEFSDRKPTQLSGGQQQRVALARALAPSPKLLLLDEPLSALDLKLRHAMRVELKQIQEEMGITFIFVTHDQEEALTMSDRIAVMSNGELQQVGTGRQIYEEPGNRFVADFIGETNLLPATVESVNGGLATCVIGNRARLECTLSDPVEQGGSGYVSIRPERISLARATADHTLTGIVNRFVYLGTDTQCKLSLDDGTEINIRVQNAHESATDLAVGERTAIIIDQGAARLLVN
ncbi:spermidine/putrescine ABC transporter ATP-binding protein [Chromatiales bacterium (ex Bugula neritina AB1)]|nr:spermidine/putrescine ABC transporter ATP-binding protein [Chromatiales bacterium (ex Bugula neritina AB1)]